MQKQKGKAIGSMNQVLLAYGIHKGFVQARTMLATQLVSDGCPEDAVHALMREAGEQGRDNPAGFVAKVLADGGWREYWEDLKKDRGKQQEQQYEDRLRSTTSSSLRFVTESNPYGWSDPERMRGTDHGEPEVWNPYRQCYNGKMRRRPDGSYDSRYYGSARCEVIGDRMPREEWDADEVVKAKRFSESSTPIGKRSEEKKDAPPVDPGPIYGEPEPRDPLEDI